MDLLNCCCLSMRTRNGFYFFSPSQSKFLSCHIYSYKNTFQFKFNAAPNSLAVFLPMGRLPFSMAEIWACGIPVISESCFCVIPSRYLAPDRQRPPQREGSAMGGTGGRGDLLRGDSGVKKKKAAPPRALSHELHRSPRTRARRGFCLCAPPP